MADQQATAFVPKDGTVLQAGLWMIGAITSFTAMAIAGRTVSIDLDTFEIMLYRSMTGICIVLIIGFATGALSRVRLHQPGLHLARNLAHFTGQNLWFYAIAVAPLAQVFALEFTTPLWVIVLSPLLLGERLTRIGIVAALIGFVGILIVARPSAASLNLGVLTAAMSAVCFALTAIATRKLTRTETTMSILLFLTVFQGIFGLICAGFDGDITLPTATTAPWVVLIGCAGLLAHYCLTTALSLAPASVVMPIDFARLPAIAVVGALVYAEPLDPLVFLGAALIFGGNWLNIRSGQPVRKS